MRDDAPDASPSLTDTGPVAAAFGELNLAPQSPQRRSAFAIALRSDPEAVEAGMAQTIHRLLLDPGIDPADLGRAGWMLQRHFEPRLETARDESDLAALSQQLEHNEFAQTLLGECPVDDRIVELTLTRLRRWLGHSGRWRDHPRLIAALTQQTALNGGAWPFDDAERAQWRGGDAAPLAATYLPSEPDPDDASAADDRGTAEAARPDRSASVTRAVAEQYERRPYPAWRRITRPTPIRLADAIRPYDLDLASRLPERPHILVAGCGTGQQAAAIAARYPAATVTAVDLSEASLAYARRHCADAGLTSIRFHHCDLHDIASLGETFDAIFCAGVLHHLPDPERGWSALAAVLKPGGVMRVALYSRVGRLRIAGAKALLRDLINQPINDDVLRESRRRLLARRDLLALAPIVDSWDFSTLAGTCDLLFHSHEDPFDVPRIQRAMSALRLRLLGVDLPSVATSIAYARLFPSDPHCRDFANWRHFEQQHPSAFMEMYTFWCAWAVPPS